MFKFDELYVAYHNIESVMSFLVVMTSSGGRMLCTALLITSNCRCVSQYPISSFSCFFLIFLFLFILVSHVVVLYTTVTLAHVHCRVMCLVASVCKYITLCLSVIICALSLCLSCSWHISEASFLVITDLD